MIGGSRALIRDGSLSYAGRTRPLDGATATFTEQRRGVPLLTRRTEYHVTVSGPDWTVTGRAVPLPFAWWRRGARVQGFVNRVNGF